MHPELIRLGPLTLHWYGVLVASAFLAAIWWSMREADRRGLDRNVVPDLAFWVVIGAIVGARLLYILIDLPYFLDNPLQMVAFWEGGLVFSGGLAVASVLGYWKMRRQPRKLEWCDSIAPGIALGQGIGRLGCFMAGCCYGAKTHMPWGVIFSDPNSLAPIGVSLHPTQLYQSAGGFITFATLVWFSRRGVASGRVAGLYLIMFGLFRIFIEYFRADWRGDFGFASVTQVVTGCFLFLGLYLFTRKNRSSVHA